MRPNGAPTPPPDPLPYLDKLRYLWKCNVQRDSYLVSALPVIRRPLQGSPGVGYSSLASLLSLDSLFSPEWSCHPLPLSSPWGLKSAPELRSHEPGQQDVSQVRALRLQIIGSLLLLDRPREARQLQSRQRRASRALRFGRGGASRRLRRPKSAFSFNRDVLVKSMTLYKVFTLSHACMFATRM